MCLGCGHPPPRPLLRTHTKTILKTRFILLCKPFPPNTPIGALPDFPHSWWLLNSYSRYVISDYRIPRAYLAAPSEGRPILASNAILGPSSLDFLVPYWQGTSAYWPLLALSCLYRGSRFPYNLPWSEIQDLTMGPKKQTTSILGYLATIMAPSSPI